MVKPLLKEAGIGGIILENPFYGLRKPTDQIRSSLHNVSDIFVMGGCLILESLVLFHWCERNGLGPLGVTGLSMGGHMASLAATNWPKPLVLVPCLSWSTASAVFLQGVMSHSINWDLLEDQYLSDGIYREKLSKMVTIIDEAFLAGKKFARTYSQNIRCSLQKSPTPLVDNIKVETPYSSLDITYKECVSDTKSRNTGIDATKSVREKSVREKLNEDIKSLLEQNKISESLHNKLTSNKKFELDPEEIDLINKLSENKLKEAILNVCNMDKSSTENNEKVETKAVTSAAKKKSWNVSDLTSDLWLNLPFTRSSGKKIDIGKIHWRDRETLQFMRGIMDECTHLSNFSVPFDTSLIIAVCAKHDAYVPRDDVGTLEEIWPGAEVRYVDAGHVSAYILHQSLFRSCIKEAFERSKKKWRDGKHVD
ncbi:protein ABHD18 isoform X2 [Leptidea sinapis]|nr:protein ABHD18 isoform X2 [Leptidea sinapis]